MFGNRSNKGSARAIFAALLFAAAAQAATTLRMPAKYALPKAAKSPGQVSFNHSTHVLADEPNCVACHPRTFSILEPGNGAARPSITHAAMDKGQACGACHGKTAFKLTNCKNCHD